MRSSQPFLSRHFGLLPTAVCFSAAVVALDLAGAALTRKCRRPPLPAGGGRHFNQVRRLIENASVDELGKLEAELGTLVKNAPADLNAAASLRKVSLRGLEEAIEESLKSGKALPDEVLFLAGLQDIRYVFVYPEEKDIVLVGFGEGWRIDDRGNIVGVTTGKPVLAPGRPAHRAADRRVVGPDGHQLLDRSDGGRHPAISRATWPP